MAASELVLPVGHLVGQVIPGPYEVRIGGELIGLRPDEFRIWALAHGDPSRSDQPWTSADLLEAAAEVARIPDPAPLVSALKAKDALAQAGIGTLEAAEFARAHRLVPLMVGLGVRDDDTYGIGFTLYSQPSLVVDATLHSIWRYAPFTTSIWDLAQQLSRSAIDAGIDPDDASEDVVLSDILESLHVLLSRHAGYLDRAKP